MTITATSYADAGAQADAQIAALASQLSAAQTALATATAGEQSETAQITALQAQIVTLTAELAAAQAPPPVVTPPPVIPPTLYPNQPSGFTPFAETNDGFLPSASVLRGSVAEWAVKPATLLTVVPTPVPFPTGQADVLKFIFAKGTAAGYQEPAGEYVDFYLGQNQGMPNGGPAADEWSSLYCSVPICVVGNGTDMEVPGAGGFKLFLLGSTYNNLNASGGFAQMFVSLRGVNKTTNGALPDTFTEFYVDLYTQNFANQDLTQNVNTSKHVVVGQVHQLELLLTEGTDQGGNGTVDIWLDGEHIVSYQNVQVLDHTKTYAGSPGTAGFTVLNVEPWWGGAGGPAKSRDDVILFGHLYLSGVFKQARA